MTTKHWLFIVLIACLMVLFLLIRRIKRQLSKKKNKKRSSHQYNRHQYNVNQASKRLKTLKSIKSPARQFGYLRKVDPYVFEEMILTALKNRGHKIIRNKKYSGDGGIDGIVYIKKEKFLIQAKRYKQHIKKQHIKEFKEICMRRQCRGLFIHTGRTGASSRKESSDSIIQIISGAGILNLLNG